MTKKPLYIIHYTLYIALALSAFAEEIRVTEGFSWIAITDPGEIIIPEPTLSDPPGFVHEAVDTPLTPDAGFSAHSAMDGIQRMELRDRIRAKAAGKYPPLLYLTLTIPAAARTAERVVIEAELPYDGEIDITKCVQLIPLDRGAPTPGVSATVQEAAAELDFAHTITATPDRDGIFRFDFTETVRSITDGTIGNRFVLKPFKPRDSFDTRSITAGTFAFVLGDEE